MVGPLELLIHILEHSLTESVISSLTVNACTPITGDIQTLRIFVHDDSVSCKVARSCGQMRVFFLYGPQHLSVVHCTSKAFYQSVTSVQTLVTDTQLHINSTV